MPPHPQPARALLIALGTLLLAQLLGSLAAAAGGEDELLALVLYAALTEVVILGVALAGAHLARRGPLRALGIRRGRLSWRRTGLLVVGTLAASHALDGLARLSGVAEGSVLRELPEILAGATGARRVAALVAIGLAPAFAEELLCRGLIQRSLVRRLGAWPGIALASLLFGALHVDLVHAGFAAVLGLYLGVAAHWDDSTRAPILCHAVNNSAGVLALTAAGGASTTATPASVAGGTVLALACLWWVARGRPERAVGHREQAVPRGPGRASPGEPGGGLQPPRGSDDG